MMHLYFISLILLCTCAACQTASLKADEIPTLPPAAPPTLVIPVARTPRPLVLATAVIPVDPTISPTASPAPTITATETSEIVVGYSAGGLPITARQLGSGDHVLLLVGGIHGGYEANTVTLMHELIAYFEENPDALPARISLLIVPVANPDGMQFEDKARGRFNANGVDLNRNWGCGWSSAAYWRDQRVSAGSEAMSEPETQALAALMRAERPAAALFYHSAANGVYEGECDGDHGSALLAEVLGEATGYRYRAAFSAYPVTGTAASWADGEGIPAADVELANHDDTEFERNLRGVLAVIDWIGG